MCLSMLGITFPAIMEICVLWPDKLGRLNIVVWRNVLLIIIGFIGLIFGTGKSLADIIRSFQVVEGGLEAVVNATEAVLRH